MKNLFLMLLSVSLISFSCKKDETANNAGLATEPEINVYWKDAKNIYYQEIFDNQNHHNRNDANFDQGEISTIFGMLKAVHALQSKESNAVFGVHTIRKLELISLNRLSIQVDGSALEIQNLIKGVQPTGNAKLDELMTNYKFKVMSPSINLSKFPFITLKSSSEYNLTAVVKEFEKLKSVKSANVDRAIGNSMNILLKRNGTKASLSFKRGWGDCPAGCIHHQIWEFEVSEGVARFVKFTER